MSLYHNVITFHYAVIMLGLCNKTHSIMQMQLCYIMVIYNSAVYVYMQANLLGICMCVHVCMYIGRHASVCTCIYVCMKTYIHESVYMYVSID